MVAWTRELAVGREMGRNGYFQDIFSKAELTEFAEELDVVCKTTSQ